MARLMEKLKNWAIRGGLLAGAATAVSAAIYSITGNVEANFANFIIMSSALGAAWEMGNILTRTSQAKERVVEEKGDVVKDIAEGLQYYTKKADKYQDLVGKLKGLGGTPIESYPVQTEEKEKKVVGETILNSRGFVVDTAVATDATREFTLASAEEMERAMQKLRSMGGEKKKNFQVKL